MRRIALISDTLSEHTNVDINVIKKADILICSGSVSKNGFSEQIISFLKWLKNVPVKYKIFIGGARDSCLSETYPSILKEIDKFQDDNNFYLLNSSLLIDGISIYGTPFSRRTVIYGEEDYLGKSFSFYDDKSELAEWNKIPSDTEILISNTQPYEILDYDIEQKHLGSKQLRDKVESLPKLKLHSFGKVENNGIVDTFETRFVNSRVTNYLGRVTYSPTLIDVNFD